MCFGKYFGSKLKCIYFLAGNSENKCDLVVFDCRFCVSEIMGILDGNQGSSWRDSFAAN